MESAQIIGIAVFLGVVLIFLIIVYIKTNIVICKPNEIVILSGRQRKLTDGTKIGYRIIRGGRSFKMPFIESVSRLSLATRSIDINLSKVLCAGMIPLEIEGKSNIKLAGKESEGLENAVERFIGKPEHIVDRTAQQVIEGSVRGVLASFSPAEANEKRIEVIARVLEHSQQELKKLGIVLDAFQILSISDHHGHLEAIGRKRNSEVLKEAKIAEAIADAEARAVTAEQMKAGREAEIKADMVIVTNENKLAVTRANLKAEENKAEMRAEIVGEISKSEEQLRLEEIKVNLSRKSQEANTVIPAEAKKKAMSLEAEGNSAKILEDGKATAKAVELMLEQWKDGASHDLFLIRMLPDLFDKATSVISDNFNVEKLTIMDSGEGEGLSNYVKNLSKSSMVFFEHLKNTTGIDIEKLAKGNESGLELPKKKP